MPTVPCIVLSDRLQLSPLYIPPISFNVCVCVCMCVYVCVCVCFEGEPELRLKYFQLAITSTAVVCHTILKIQELEAALAQIDEWETLCENLGVPLATLHELHSMSLPSARKKRRCLEAFLCTGHACWETVVRAVADCYNIKLAGKIANKYGIDNSWIADYRQGYD